MIHVAGNLYLFSAGIMVTPLHHSGLVLRLGSQPYADLIAGFRLQQRDRDFSSSPSGPVMLVHFVTDEPAKIPAIRQVLEPRYRVVPQFLGSDGKQPASERRADDRCRPAQGISCRTDPAARAGAGSRPEKLFVVRNSIRPLVAQAYVLGATSVVSRPRDIMFELEQIDFAGEPRANRDPATAPPEVTDSATAFASMFSAVASANRSDLPDAEQCDCRKSSTASGKTASARGLTTCGAITKARSSIACW